MKRRTLWTAEIILWSLVIFLAIFFVSQDVIKNTSSRVHINLPIEDTDGLIVGSPVKLMGVQIGYISNFKIKETETVVTFVITKKNVTIPKGSVAGVEFSGLAGSKSLEIYPPETKINGDLKALQTIRIQNFLEKQQDIASNIIDMSNNFNDVIKKNNISRVRNLLKSKDIFINANNFLDEINSFQDDSLAKMQNKQKKEKQNAK